MATTVSAAVVPVTVWRRRVRRCGPGGLGAGEYGPPWAYVRVPSTRPGRWVRPQSRANRRTERNSEGAVDRAGALGRDDGASGLERGRTAASRAS